jgi:hypothetical protein
VAALGLARATLRVLSARTEHRALGLGLGLGLDLGLDGRGSSVERRRRSSTHRDLIAARTA